MASTAELRPSSSPRALATPTPIATSSSKVIKSLDGVRGLAILLVVWCHLAAYLQPPIGVHSTPTLVSVLNGGIGVWIRVVAENAGIGVNLFFVLSGFLLFLPYARVLGKLQRPTWPSWKTFYLRRVKRIMPAYLTVFVAVVCFMAVMLAQPDNFNKHLAWNQLLPGLVLMFDFHRSTFDLIAGVNPIIGTFDSPLWSLTVEWQFYLMLPILAWGLSRLGTRRRVIYALLLLVIYGLVLRSFAAWVHYSDGIEDPADAPGLLGLVSSILFGIRGKFIEIFALGMLASIFYVWAIEERHWTHIQARKLAYTLMPVCILGIVYSFLWAVIGVGRFTDTNAFFWPSIERHGASAVAYAIAGDWLLGVWAVLFVVIVLCLPHSWGRAFSLRPLTFAGMISYSLYLWHWPIMRLKQITGVGLHPIVTLSVIFAWSVVLYYVVERPFLRYRHSK